MSTVPLVLREYAGPARSRPRATWKQLKLDGGTSATVSCPGCGCVATLEDHQIDIAGLVTPSVQCPNRCGFHDYVALINWEVA